MISNIISLYSFYSPDSFSHIDSWLKDVKTQSNPDVKVFLIGNKTDLEDIEITKEQLLKIKEEHLKRIELADTIFVVNKDDYIGDSTKLEIEYANKLGKKIMYYKDIKTI